ncbi:hypothetical protein Goklo_024283 [Gossypium klotzschianum]|uniref:Uncharacterized protein n=1 Tax=Gossypium klotzschianum TaxID=34286 RepID=A0A7J8W6I2_9ROSI|nr:hypothetical protein [Gossypium klotzschianum]
MSKEEIQSLQEDLAQAIPISLSLCFLSLANAISDQKAQSMTEAKTFGKVSGLLSKVSESCRAKMIDEEKLAEEVNFTLKYVGGRLETLTLKTQSDQKMVLSPHLNPESSNPMGALWGPFSGLGEPELDPEYFQKLGSLMDDLFPNNEIFHALGEGSSDGSANQANMKLSQEKTSAVPGYNFYEPNIMCSLKYFKSTLILITSFLFSPADIQSTILTSLAEVDHKIESNPEMLELKDITDIEAKVQNIMNKLAKAREMLEEQAEEKRLKEEIEKEEVDLNEKKLKLAWMQKRPRIM